MTETRVTSCNRDCPDTCVLHVDVDEHGALQRLRGDPDDPITQGFLCARTRAFDVRQNARDRITRPLLREHGVLVPVSWDEALDVAAERLSAVRAEHGPAGVLHYRSGGSLGILTTLADRLFEAFGPVTIKRGDICSGAGEAAQETDFGVCDSHDLHDLAHSEAIVVWGKNPHTSGVHLLPLLRDARKRGVPLVGVDPVRTKLADVCDVFVQPRPGGDGPLALGVARWLFDHDRVAADAADWCAGLDAFTALVRRHDVAGWAERAGVAAAEVEAVARVYGEHRPAALLVGWGLARRRHGAASVRVLDALGAVTGNVGARGGGVSYAFARQASFDLPGSGAAARSVREACLGADVLACSDPPVRAVWVTAGNPVAMLPDSATVRAALQAADFVCVVDTHPTDTTDVADLVLPTLTLLEDSDVLGAYGHHWIRESRPTLPAPDGPWDARAPNGAGDTPRHAPRGAEHFVGAPGPRHELEILQGLAARLGLADVLDGDLEHWKRAVTRSLEAAGAGLDAVRAGPVRNPARPEVLFADRRFPTPSGKVELIGDWPADAPQPDDDYPLLLLAGSAPGAQSSQWTVGPPDGPARVRVHPEAAAGFADGAAVRLASRVGALDVVVVHDPDVRRGVALMAKGGALRDGRCANLLVTARETDAGGGACYYDEPVRLEAAS